VWVKNAGARGAGREMLPTAMMILAPVARHGLPSASAEQQAGFGKVPWPFAQAAEG
jgi:hypothetical protein